MEIDGKDVPLSPGMAVTVEIKTGATGHQLPDVADAPRQTGSPARAVSACIDPSLVDP
jgi:hypothetical protein